MSGFSRDFHPREGAEETSPVGSLAWLNRRVLELDDELTDQKAAAQEQREISQELMSMHREFLQALPGIIEHAVKEGTKAGMTDQATVKTFIGVALGIGAQDGATRFTKWTMSWLLQLISLAFKVALLLLLAGAIGGWPLMLKVWHAVWP